MTWRNALAFRQVAEQRSFVRAAAASGVSQPALSKRVAQLERQLRASLLFRTTRRVELTDAGEIVFGAVCDMERLWSTALQTLGTLKTAPARLLPSPPTVAGRTAADASHPSHRDARTARSSTGPARTGRPGIIDLEEARTVLVVATEGVLGPA
ncbi:MAG: LysR family transcriptional regulator, partial [Aldersonia sp.]|nr:LysR family transcriptional regulator [Aldersonia sp.]